MTYQETIRYLESFINYEKVPSYPYKESLKLERIKDFLSSIGNPQYDLKCIHIAGTKGKGSTCAFVSYILKEAGFKVGLYTSPHLSDFRERIRILRPSSNVLRQTSEKVFEGMIPRRDLVGLVGRLKPAIKKFTKNSKFGPLSFFEVYTALAFVYFKAKAVDFMVLETGLGGRLDSTNTARPLVCGISPISLEHTQKLGNTLKEIAVEKAGIIQSHKVTKSQSHKLIVISAPQEKEALEAIKNRCKNTGAKLFEIGKDIIYQKSKSGFSVKGVFYKYPDLKIRLLGRHQITNACVAIGVIEALKNYNINISPTDLKKGLYNTVWPGRCEIIARRPLIVADGAQNVASIQALKKAVREKFKFNRIILVIGVSGDKDMEGISREITAFTDEAVLTRADNPRAMPVDKMEAVLKDYINGRYQITKTRSVREALAKAIQKSRKGDLVLVTGSLFVVGEARDILKKKNNFVYGQ